MNPEPSKGLLFIQGWNPACRFLGCLCLILSQAFLSHLFCALAGCVLALLLSLAAGFSIRQVWCKVRWLLLFLAPLFVLIPVHLSWEEVHGFTVGFQAQRLAEAGLVVARALGVAMLLFPMMADTSFPRMLGSLRQIGLSSRLVNLAMFTHRYTCVYLQQVHRMHTALKSRGFIPRFNLDSLRVIGVQVGMLLVTSFDQAERVLMAMKARGYQGTFPPGEAQAFLPMDWLKCALFSFIGLVLVSIDRRVF